MLGPIGTVLVIWLHQVIFKVLFEVNPSHTRHHPVACLTCSSCIQPPMSTPRGHLFIVLTFHLKQRHVVCSS
ncbi:hypothetical protein Bpfe_013680, partial [Biomphalaria pfeifferi]